jgi:TetR/AcrR family transcriptional regulator, transcriptional repressor for nem operon
MGRPREFDFGDTLERAMQTFWAKGYEATSLDDLCAATGLGRSSLYAAFGDKQNLYLSALAHYESAAVGRITAALSASKSPLEGIAAFIDRIIGDIVAGPGRRGCFIGNCAAELARQDRAMASHVRQSMDRIQNTFRMALVQAKDAGQLPKHADVDALAAFLMSGIQGLRLVGKANPDRAVLKNIATVMLRCIEQ